MSLAAGQIITWTDLSTTCLNSIKNVCCNIDSYKNVPDVLQQNTGQVNVHTIATKTLDGKVIHNFYYYANPQNTIPLVTFATVNSEWTTFLSAAGINTRSNKVVQACDFGKAMGLYMQFMGHHLKHVHCRLQIYNRGIFTGTKYLGDAIVGRLTPKYTLTPIEPGNIPETTDNDITNIVLNTLQNPGLNWGIMDTNSNPIVNRHYLS